MKLGRSIILTGLMVGMLMGQVQGAKSRASCTSSAKEMWESVGGWTVQRKIAVPLGFLSAIAAVVMWSLETSTLSSAELKEEAMKRKLTMPLSVLASKSEEEKADLLREVGAVMQRVHQSREKGEAYGLASKVILLVAVMVLFLLHATDSGNALLPNEDVVALYNIVPHDAHFSSAMANALIARAKLKLGPFVTKKTDSVL